VRGSTLLPRPRRAPSRLLPHYHRNGNINRASQVLAQEAPPSVPRSYCALADRGNVPYSTLHHRACRRPSMEEKARGQQYLKLYKVDVVVKYLLQMSDLRQPIRMQFIPFIAFRVT
jgi:hypothetical protein